ncbi:hypothetical protein KKF61_02490 [Patescibacteria group bacterium]|nr:hypothetical protein [Patescibacteria group bacterium]MBU0964221.1 hypothetical protein [Patescibacteria group bacterium]
MSIKITQWTIFILTVALVVTVIAMLSWYFIEGEGIKSELNASNNIINSPSNKILIGCDKFSPEIMTITVGQSITFINRGCADSQIVSEYPQARYVPQIITNVLEKDESFSISFPLPGEWAYYDGLDIDKKGRVIIQ